MDIEEVLAGMIAALRSGSTFAMIVHSDSKSQQCICSSAVNTKIIYKWLYERCFPKKRNMNKTQRRQLEKHMHTVSESLMASYELSNTLGCAMAECVEATAASYHAQKRAEDLRAGVAAMPKATIKLLTALPILALFAGELLGGHPILMLITTVNGWILLTIGGICYGLGLAWVSSMLQISQHAMDAASLEG